MKTKFTYLVFTLLTSLFLISCTDRGVESPDENDGINPSIPGTISIISPPPGEIIKPGSTYIIKWSSSVNYGKVQVTLYRKRELKSILTLAAESNGELIWKIPPDMHKSIHYRIQITSIDFPTVSSLSEYFQIMD